MPANLTQEYYAAEQDYRRARTPAEKLEGLQAMLRAIPKHKGTDHMQADLKKRISQAKRDSQKKSARAVHSLYVKPEGIGQVFLVGPPNSGKSSLLDVLTNAKPEIAAYPFTTSMYQPGMMRHVDIWIQLVDMPPVSEQSPIPWIPSVVRYGHAALFVLSLASDDVLTEAEEVTTRLAAGKVVLARRGEPTGMFDNGIAALKTLMVLTHSKAPDALDRLELLDELLGDAYEKILVDIREDPESLEVLRKRTYDMLGKLRVYTKQPAKPPDMEDPFVIRRGTTLEELAGRIHKDIRARLRFARVWSQDESMFDGQRVSKDYVLQEGDVVEIHA
jgi:uncharacterized protein